MDNQILPEGASLLPLSGGKFAIVDTDLLSDLLKSKWSVNKLGYVQRWEQEKKLHRYINQTPTGLHTDHINGDKLDNRRANLRSCTVQENMRNRMKSNKWGYKGVSKSKRVDLTRPFEAKIFKDGVRIKMGGYATAEEAARAYDAKAKEWFGEYAYLNFP